MKTLINVEGFSHVIYVFCFAGFFVIVNNEERSYKSSSEVQFAV